MASHRILSGRLGGRFFGPLSEAHFLILLGTACGHTPENMCISNKGLCVSLHICPNLGARGGFFEGSQLGARLINTDGNFDDWEGFSTDIEQMMGIVTVEEPYSIAAAFKEYIEFADGQSGFESQFFGVISLRYCY